MSQHDVRRRGGALFADPGQDGLIHRAFLRGAGVDPEAVRRSPVIGVCSSWSELNPCNAGLRALAEAVKAGVRAAGGLPLEFPTISISEPYTRPTSLFLRNLMSMDVEETVAASPIDGVVLLGGCDKTVPAQLMGALSANVPAVMVTAGPRPVPCRGGEPFTIDDLWPAVERRRTGALGDAEWAALEGEVNVGVGTCNVMGTAITMAAIAEVLGFALPGSALPSAASAELRELAEATGALAVATARAGRRPRDLVTPRALENAFRVACALGGSTNAVLHLEAIAGRAGVTIGPRTWEAWAATTPWVADVRPNGRGLLADLEAAGGVPAVMRRVAALLHLDARAATGAAARDAVR
ncbi:dihydroxy-acid dehydratase, partial [Roseisolibacter sp. H3M3-2]|uniref:dihydroxy-acid dehydratase domain-containing protein n=1 Tax=Roseisolibacter sp. H3M3-2 TaxID=3031323 RepID=UPI0023DC0CF3